MAETIRLTAVPTAISGGNFFPNIWATRDVSDYDLIDLEVELVSVASLSGSITVNFVTGWDQTAYSLWPTFTSSVVSATSKVAVITLDTSQLLGYLGWWTSSAAGTSAWISVTGMGRATED